jgi:predicted dehydrogenase
MALRLMGKMPMLRKRGFCYGRPVMTTLSLSRRQFLQSSAAVAGATLPLYSTLAANTAPKKIRMGVVGGGFGTSFQWHEHPDCVVEAVSDLRPERRKGLMRVYQCSKSYNSLEELVLDKNIDAVAVFTEGPNHVKHIGEVMKHGKHAISAVPASLGGGLAEAEQLLDTVKKYGLTYMMAETSYYQQPTISVRKFHEQGKFGQIYYCEAEYQHPGLESLYFEPGAHALPDALHRVPARRHRRADHRGGLLRLGRQRPHLQRQRL